MAERDGLLTFATHTHTHSPDTNGFDGKIPSTVAQATSLQNLALGMFSAACFLGHSNLSVELTSFLKISSSTVDFNELTGPIPSELGLMYELTNLDLCTFYLWYCNIFIVWPRRYFADKLVIFLFKTAI
jgi:hypothetical protein